MTGNIENKMDLVPETQTSNNNRNRLFATATSLALAVGGIVGVAAVGGESESANASGEWCQDTLFYGWSGSVANFTIDSGLADSYASITAYGDLSGDGNDSNNNFLGDVSNAGTYSLDKDGDDVTDILNFLDKKCDESESTTTEATTTTMPDGTTTTVETTTSTTSTTVVETTTTLVGETTTTTVTTTPEGTTTTTTLPDGTTTTTLPDGTTTTTTPDRVTTTTLPGGTTTTAASPADIPETE